jgi:HK97 family phage portal protein
MLNPRINCNRHPLIGETPISAYVNSAAGGGMVQRTMSRFFANMARPSGVLSTPKTLTEKQIDQLRDAWNKAGQADNIGKTPVLHSELKWEQVTMSAVDAETIAFYQLTVSDIAMAYRIPLFMLGDLSKATFRNVESLMRVFYTSSLRFYLEHLENNLNALFEFDGVNDYVEFDIEAGLLRGDFLARIEAYTKGIQGGLFTPNEGRAAEGKPAKTGGDDLYMQRQMVPLSLLAKLTQADIAGANKPEPEPEPEDEAKPGEEDDDKKPQGEEEDPDEEDKNFDGADFLRRELEVVQ